MKKNALLDELLTEQWATGLAAPEDKVRMAAAIAEILDAGRPASVTKGKQLVYGALKVVLIVGIVFESFEAVYNALGKILGRDIPEGVCLRCGAQAVMVGTPAGKSHPNGGGR